MGKAAKGIAPHVNEWEDFSQDTGVVAISDLKAAIENAGVFVYDLETTGLRPLHDRIEGVAFYVPRANGAEAVRAWYPFVPYTFLCYAPPPPDGSQPELLDLREPMDQEETMEALRVIWSLQDVISIAQNGKFDMAFLRHASGAKAPVEVQTIAADAMLADFCADERHRQYGLKQRVLQVFGHQMTTYSDAVRGQTLLPFCNAKPLGVYAMDDCLWTYRHHENALERLRRQTPASLKRTLDGSPRTVEAKLGRIMGKLERIYWGIDTPVSRILMEMEQAGCLIDWEWLVEIENKLEEKKRNLLHRIESFLSWPLNPNAPKQVADALFAMPPDGLGLPQTGIPVGKSGDPSTSDKIIKHFKRYHPLVEDILEVRSIDTVLGGFVTKLIDLATNSHDGRVRTHFNQTGTVIGRLSSSRPINFMNQPREENLVRRAFCAYLPSNPNPDMELFGADYGQIELRVAAHLANEKNMIEVYEMGGICGANSGLPCDRYTWYECKSCHYTGPPVSPTPGKRACAKCGNLDPKTFEHQARCRHVDLHQRTADDANVPRNPLAKCLDGDTLILAGGDGEWPRPVAIKQLLADIEPGEHRKIPTTHVATADGFAVANSAIKRHKRPTKIVITRRAVVVATEDHRFQVIGDYDSLDPNTPGYVHVPGRSLVEARNLEKGMKLPFVDAVNPRALEDESAFHTRHEPQELRINPFTKEVDPDGPASIRLNEEWAYFAGMFAGDGCASGNSCVITHGSSGEYAEWRRIVRDVCDAVGLPNRVSKNKKHTLMGSRVVRRYLAGMGLAKESGATGAKIMRVPEWVLAGGPKLMWSYFAGLFDTDGTVGKEDSGSVSITSKYPEFVGQVALMLRWLGMPVSIQPAWNKTYERWYYTLHVLAEGYERFIKYCPLRYREKAEKLHARNANVKRRVAPSDDEVLLVLDGGERTVYDFQIDTPDHLYLQGGLIGHNNLNFGLLYRMGAPKFCIYADLFDAEGVPRVGYAKDVIARWHRAYPQVADFHERTEAMLEKNGWIAETLFGRRRRLAQERRYNHYRAVTQGIQFQVSGSAQDIMKTAMVRIFEGRNERIDNSRPAERRLWKRVRFLIQVHDEIQLEAPIALTAEVTTLIHDNMVNVGKGFLRVPLAVDVKHGPNWDRTH